MTPRYTRRHADTACDPPSWRRYLRFCRPDVQADIDDELRFHFDERIEELVEQGATPDAARAQRPRSTTSRRRLVSGSATGR